MSTYRLPSCTMLHLRLFATSLTYKDCNHNFYTIKVEVGLSRRLKKFSQQGTLPLPPQNETETSIRSGRGIINYRGRIVTLCHGSLSRKYDKSNEIGTLGLGCVYFLELHNSKQTGYLNIGIQMLRLHLALNLN